MSDQPPIAKHLVVMTNPSTNAQVSIRPKGEQPSEEPISLRRYDFINRDEDRLPACITTQEKPFHDRVPIPYGMCKLRPFKETKSLDFFLYIKIQIVFFSSLSAQSHKVTLIFFLVKCVLSTMN